MSNAALASPWPIGCMSRGINVFLAKPLPTYNSAPSRCSLLIRMAAPRLCLRPPISQPTFSLISYAAA